MHIAIIPARSGSKGLKDKNIKSLDGLPLIAYTIKAAIDAKVFDEIFVSTDSKEYADISKKYGASVPFLRNEKFATDSASSWSAVQEAVEQYQVLGKKFTTVTLLQPTSPLRTFGDIREAYETFIQNNAKAVVSICEAEHSPLWCNTLPSNHSLKGFIPPELQALPRQQLPAYYRVNGAIYIVDLLQIDLSDIQLYDQDCFAYIMPKSRSADIDTIMDFHLAEILMQCRNK